MPVHLQQNLEMTRLYLGFAHNLFFYKEFMKEASNAIKNNSFKEYQVEFLKTRKANELMHDL